MRYQRLHDIGFVAVTACCTIFLLLVARGAEERERGALVQRWEPEDAALASDLEVLEAALAELPPAHDAGDGPDVVLIVVDGLRADAVGALRGGEGGWDITPSLDRLAAGAQLVTRVQAPSSDPASSRASLLTGRYPVEHGAVRGSNGVLQRPRRELPTLAERLGSGGYRSVGISGASVGGGAQHLSRGFDAFVGSGLSRGRFPLEYARADRVTALALRAAEGIAGDPRFLWVEYRDPAVPWVGWEEWIEEPMELVSHALWWPGRKKSGWSKRRRSVLGRGGTVAEVTLQTWRSVYAAEVQMMDRELGRLLDGLAERGIDGDDWVIVVGADGMYLGEHELLGEGYDVFQEGVDVPLIVRAPDSVRAPVDATGIADMLLAALGLETLGGPEPDGLAVSEAYYAPAADMRASYGARFRHVRRAFRDGDHVLVLDDRGPSEAFDLDSDPVEREPLADADWVDALRERAGQWLAARGVDPQGADERERP